MKKILASVGALLVGSLVLAGCSADSLSTKTSGASDLDDFSGEVAVTSGDPNPTVAGAFGEVPNIGTGQGEPPKEIHKWILQKGEGHRCSKNSSVIANYRGQLWDGKAFDGNFDLEFNHNKPLQFSLESGVVDGWKEGLIGVTTGSRVLLVLPPDKGYGEQGNQSIPPNSTLVFVIDVLDCANPLDISKLNNATKYDDPPKGITVEGDLGKEPKITVAEGTAEPTERKLIVLAEGKGPAIGPDDYPLMHETDAYFNPQGDKYSTYAGKEGAFTLNVPAGSEQLGDNKVLFVGQKLGTRLMVLMPANPATGHPAMISVIDFVNKLTP